jgi:DNA repair exonuclease SbcCD nuclease subunit
VNHLIVTADWHLDEIKPSCRTEHENWLDTQARKLKWLGDLSIRYDNCPILVAGDICNYWRQRPGFLSFLIQNIPPKVFCIPGNHDLPYHSMGYYSQSALHLLEVAGTVQVLHKPTQLESSAWIYPLGLNVPPTVKRNWSSEFNVVLGHTLMWRDKCPPWAEHLHGEGHYSAQKLWPLIDECVGLVVTGDNHECWVRWEALAGRAWINPGNLLRYTLAECDNIPAVYVVSFEDTKITALKFEKCPDLVPVKSNIDVEAEINNFHRALRDDVALRKGLSFSSQLREFLAAEGCSDSVRKVMEQALKEWKDEAR